MTTKRKPYVRPMTSTGGKNCRFIALHAARRHGGSGCVVQH